MKKILSVLVLVIAAVALMSQAADAASRTRIKVHPARGVDPRVTTTAVVAGAASTAGFFAINGWRWRSASGFRNGNGLTVGGAYLITSVGCAAVAPAVATMVVNRPLTAREANTTIVGCFIPIIGPLVMDAMYANHPEWDR